MPPLSLPANTRILAALSSSEPAWPILMTVALGDHATDGDPPIALCVHPDQPGLGSALDHLRAVYELHCVVQTPLVAEPARLWPMCHGLISSTTASATPLQDGNTPPLISPGASADHPARSAAPRDLAAALYEWIHPGAAAPPINKNTGQPSFSPS